MFGLKTRIAKLSSCAALLGLISSPAHAVSTKFARACEPATHSVTIAAVGDILPHNPLQEQAYADKKHGFENLWTKVTPWLNQAHIAYGNLEGPAAVGIMPDGTDLGYDPGASLDSGVYWGTDMIFNYHPRIVADLKRSGFNLISIANNHTYDRRAIGVDRTVEAFHTAGLEYVGVKHSANMKDAWETIVDANGVRTAWIGCTEMSNKKTGKVPQLLMCGSDSAKIIARIKALYAEPSIDAVIVVPHWGQEYKTASNSTQQKLARAFLDAGASAIIGSHPHILQETEKYTTKDGRETIVAYSLGNFISFQGKMMKLSAILYVGLSKRSGQKAWVNGISYLPIWTDRGPHSVNLLEKSTQVPKKEALTLIRSLFDPSRELSAKSPVVTNLECQ